MNEIKWRKPYLDHIKLLEDTATVLVQGTEDERRRFAFYQKRILKAAEVIPFTGDVIRVAADYEEMFDLSPQDAVVFASILAHLEQRSSSANCFLDKNFKDFDASPIRETLRRYNCRLITSFSQGLGFIQSQLSR